MDYLTVSARDLRGMHGSLLVAKPQRRLQLRFYTLKVNRFKDLVTYLLNQVFDLGGMHGLLLVAQRQRRPQLCQLLALRVRLRRLGLQRVQRLVRQACAPGPRAERNASCFVCSAQSQLLLLRRQFACSSGKLLPCTCACAALASSVSALSSGLHARTGCYLERVSLVLVTQPDMHARAALSPSRLPFGSSQRFNAAVFAWRLPDVLHMPRKTCLATLGTGMRGLSHPRPLPGAPGPHAHAPAPGPIARPRPQRPRAPARAPQRPPPPCVLTAGCLLRSSSSLRTRLLHADTANKVFSATLICQPGHAHAISSGPAAGLWSRPPPAPPAAPLPPQSPCIHKC